MHPSTLTHPHTLTPSHPRTLTHPHTLTHPRLGQVLELYEMILVRHGLMVVGMPYSAKTCSYRVLAGALTRMAEGGDPDQMKVVTPVLNPKSVAIGRLYGEFDEV